MEMRVHLKSAEKLGQAWVLDSVSGSDLEQEEIPKTTEPVITQDILSRQATVGGRGNIRLAGFECHLPPRRRSPGMPGVGHIEKHDGAWGSRPTFLSRTGQGTQNMPNDAVCPGSQRSQETLSGILIEEVSLATCAPKPSTSRDSSDVVKLGHNVMRSFSIDSGPVLEIIKAFGIDMAALTILPQYGWVLITLILSVFV